MIYTFAPIHCSREWGKEIWHLSDRSPEQSETSDRKTTIHALWESPQRKEIFGVLAPDTEKFPILIKTLHVETDLSLQVHPNEKMAQELGSEPKTECWYFLDCDKTAKVYAGFKNGVTERGFKKALAENRPLDSAHEIKTTTGAFMFIPAGRLHAIGGGQSILEVQQNSDTTYRLYDYGSDRELHVQKGLKCINYNDCEPNIYSPRDRAPFATKYFQLKRISFKQGQKECWPISPKSFRYVFVTAGSFQFSDEIWNATHSCVISADHGVIDIESLQKNSELVIVEFTER